MEQKCGISYQIKQKMLSLYICSSKNFAIIWLTHESSVITISSMWIMFIFNMTVPIDESCIVLVWCWSLVSISSDLEVQWNPCESINRLTMLKCTILLTPMSLLITLVNEEVITYLTANSSHNGPLTRYAKSRVAHAPGMPGTFSPPPTSKEIVS